ncbi:MAG: hypothetical protein COA45_11170 [Zetaproteobacteria bacterium]|nr:MAG: hypothetical protein COA45_11170 [Zetaproteobacteria bacterium]
MTLIFGVGYMAYGRFIDYVVTLNEEKCIVALSENDVFSVNNSEICGCISGFVRENPFFDKESVDFKVKFGVRLRNCLDFHVAKYGLKQCDDLKVQVRQRYSRHLDCTCFGAAVIDMAVDSWSTGANITASKKILAADILQHCTK